MDILQNLAAIRRHIDAQRIDVFECEFERGTEEYFTAAIAAGFFGVDDDEQFAFRAKKN